VTSKEARGPDTTTWARWSACREICPDRERSSTSRSSFDGPLRTRAPLPGHSPALVSCRRHKGVCPRRGRRTTKRSRFKRKSATRVGIARVQYFLGTLTLHDGRPAEAQASLREAAAQLRELKAPDDEAATLGMLARAFLAEQKNRDAERASQEAMLLVRSSRNRVSVFRSRAGHCPALKRRLENVRLRPRG
jgi:Tetratricopeptide repeat